MELTLNDVGQLIYSVGQCCMVLNPVFVGTGHSRVEVITQESSGTDTFAGLTAICMP